MLSFSNCKINIGLYITEKRPDGYHNLQTIFFPINLLDVIECVDADFTTLTILGLPVPGAEEDNIILKAYRLLKKDFAQLSPVHFYLLKNIPIGSGLGAGSANGAYTLLALNKKFNLGLSQEQLINYALQLGSDCPFFIKQMPVFACGRGEVFEDINITLSGYKIAIVNPFIHISTQWAFNNIKPALPQYGLNEAITKPVEEWKNLIFNDFEPVAIKAHPVIGQIKNQLYKQGAVYASMTGSGSTVYGLFKEKININVLFPGNYFCRILQL